MATSALEEEARRLAALHNCGLLDLPAEEKFDGLVRLATLLCRTPMAAISLVDRDRQWFMARVGLAVCETARDVSFCTHALSNPREPFIVADATLDPRFADNPFVTGEPHLRFYAGIPLVNPEGFALGSLCVMDTVPRQLEPGQLEALSLLAGQVIAHIATHRWVTELTQQKAALDQHALVAATDVAGHLTHVNDRFCALLQQPPGFFRQPAGNVRDAGHPLHVFFAPSWTTVAQGKVWRGEINGHSADGTPFCLQTTVVPIKHANGRLWQHVVIGTDVTANKSAERELAQARESAREAARLKSRFVANMSHELRTPLNTINGLSALLLEQDTPESTRESARLILQCGENLLENIQTILTHASLEAGRTTLETKPFRLSAVALAAVRSTAEAAQRKGLDLDYQLAGDLPDEFIGDSFRLQQVLVNLLANAVKFTETGRVFLRLRGRPLRDARWQLRATVADTGIGIDRSIIEKLFKPFSQADDSPTRRHEGTGLGLAITKSLIELMGGTIAVASRPGRGSVFSFTFELGATAGAARVFAAGAHPDLRGKTMLVIDAHALRRHAIVAQLRAWEVSAVPAAAMPARPARADAIIRTLAGEPPADGGDGPSLTPQLWLRPTSRTALPPDATRSRVLATPCSASELSAALVALLHGAPPAETSDRPAPKPARLGERLPLRVLAADDVRTNREVIAMLCQHLGYQTDLVTNGAEVLQRLDAQTYDLLLLDVQMPVLDGLEATREICRRFPDPARRPRIIAITASAQPGDRDLGLAAGMDDYLVKPLLPRALEASIQRLFDTAAVQPEPPASAPRPAASAQAGLPWVDHAHLKAVTDGMDAPEALDLLRQFYAAVIKDFDALYPRLVAASAQRDAADLRACVHGLKGCVLSIGWTRVGAYCAEILLALSRDEPVDWAALPLHFDVLYQNSVHEMDLILHPTFTQPALA